MATGSRERSRIVFFSDSTWVGGAERYLHLLATGLDRDRFEPVLIVNRGTGPGELARMFSGAGLVVEEVSLDLPRSVSGVPRLLSTLRRLAPSILHCNLPGPWGSQYSLVAPLARLAGVRRVVSTEHLPMVSPFAKGEILRRFGGLSIDRVITVSEDNVRYLTGLHGVPRRKIRVVRLGVPLGPRPAATGLRRELGIAAGEFVCIVAGSLEERKGHARAIEAIAGLEGSRLLVAGRGKLEGALRERAAALGLGARVQFLGFRRDLDSVLVECDALVCPSTLEATPYVILEAMAAGIPVVASRIYGIPEIVVDGVTGILVDPAVSGALGAALASLARDRSVGSRMGAAGRKRCEEHFRLERCVAETEAIYRELLGARGGGGS
jgi:glycosyltransferase involved in cell wall biosynthesis